MNSRGEPTTNVRGQRVRQNDRKSCARAKIWWIANGLNFDFSKIDFQRILIYTRVYKRNFWVQKCLESFENLCPASAALSNARFRDVHIKIC